MALKLLYTSIVRPHYSVHILISKTKTVLKILLKPENFNLTPKRDGKK